MMVSLTERLALTAVFILLPGGAAGFRSGDALQPIAVTVHCTENSMVVTARADLYGSGRLVTAGELRLGPETTAGNCGAVQREVNELVITAGLHECGAELRVDEDSLIYANTLFHTPTVSPFGIVRTAGVAVPLECRYKRTHLVSSTSQAHPFRSSTPTQDNLMSDRSLDELKPDDVVSMVASVLSAQNSAFKLFLDRCEVTLEPDAAATPTCDLINDPGCSAESSISFLPGADGHVLRVKLNLPSLLRDRQQADDSMLLRCWMKTADPSQRKISVNEACSYVGNSWCSVDGKHKVCECCDRKWDVFSR